MSNLIPARGKRWGLIATVLESISQRTKLTARRIQEWARSGRIQAFKVGKNWYVAVEDVLAAEVGTRRTVERLGTTPRGATGRAVLA